ncbi:hypothetical protein FQ330_05805 [Agrococcus sediminis]|uniref:Uncharacterized protein n=1 Tax=Agrococcus sediminis TaxID=2599924 RepID=A0A5M8QKS3_9MICO|nr:hypothetical protein [Agrococcus sediminis]KAA6435263.1 hypothetical protein FQ330_05805 [Agrococcus sediminis]RWR22917.1 hypothetical protein D8Y24_07430 [Agrococcus lahaulensis]
MDARDGFEITPVALPEFRIARPHPRLGDPDFDPVDAVLDSPEFRDAIIWKAQGGEAALLEDANGLAAKVRGLDDNRFGIVKRRAGSVTPFAQTLRIGDAWIVEVHDGTDDDWAHRVLRAARSVPAGQLDPAESWNASDAADIMWSWLHGDRLEHLQRVPLR